MTNHEDEPRVELDDDNQAASVIVPWDRLSDDALQGVISEFVTREGTEYGEHEVPLKTKIAQVMQQLERGDVVLLFDAKSESVNLVRAAELRAASRG